MTTSNSPDDYGPGLLAPYRVLDLTDGRGLLCGKMLADLGADVVQVEPPGGSPARNVGPFYHDNPGVERSLFWWANCANKRGITLNVATDDGAALLRRMGAYRESAGGTYTRINWPCKDGYVNFQPGGGTAGSARSVRALLEWMTEEGMGSPELDAVNWEELGYGTARAEIMEQTVADVAPFFMTHTRNELADGALERRILLFPVATPSDILAHRQLAARDYYDRIQHDDIGETVTYPGHFVKDMQDAKRVGIRRRAPHIGEHNREILGGELGLKDRDLTRLAELGVI